MLRTKFLVFPKKLWNHFKFEVFKFDETIDWKFVDGNSRNWRKLRLKKLPSIFSHMKIRREDVKFEKNRFRPQNLSPSQKFFCKFFCKKEFAVQNSIPSRKNQIRYKAMSPNEIKRTQSCFLGITLPKELVISKIPLNYEMRQRYKTDCIGDDMSRRYVKEAPASYKSSLVTYEAGKSSSKLTICDCESKKTSKCKNSVKSRKSTICELDENERYAKISTSNIITGSDRFSVPSPYEKKKKCVKEIKAIMPPQENKESYLSDSCDEINAGSRFNHMSLKRKKKSFTINGLKNGPSKRCAAVRSAPTCCTSPCKRNSLSKSSVSPSTLGPLSCCKPTIPCQPAIPICSPPPPCPPPPCPPPCPPPPSPDCSPPKMEALQFDPTSKTLNFYMLNVPTSIRKDEILVQIVYSGVCGSDFSIMEGKFAKVCKPVILGHEFSGTACVVGSGVTHVKSGDCIAINPYTACHVCKYCVRGQFGACTCEGINNTLGIHKDGGWAEFIVVNKAQVYQIPECLNLGQAVLIQPLSCIVNAMSKLDMPFGSDIVIQGTGVTGCLWASLLHMQGYRNVIACDICEYKRKIFQNLNLQFCIVPPEKLCDVKADIVIDCTGSGSSIERGVKMLNSQGQLLIFGIPSPDEEISIQPNVVAKKELKILSIITNANSFAKSVKVAEMMGCRYLDYEKLGIQTFRLGQYEGAFNMKKCGEISKIVFEIQNSKN